MIARDEHWWSRFHSSRLWVADRFLVVVTDLDGTLLDTGTHSFADATEGLDYLSALGIPLVMCSSRTQAEIRSIQFQVGVVAPFISENGAALHLPHGFFDFRPAGSRSGVGHDVLAFGRPYAEVVDLLQTTAAALRIDIHGFSDMSVEEVAAFCRLSLADARLAKLREYDEPFRILDSSPAVRSRLFGALQKAGLRALPGERFHHATGVMDKRESLETLIGCFSRAWGDVLTIGLGDGHSDGWLLRQVDIPVVVQNHATGATARLLRKIPTAYLTSDCGPRGFSEAISKICGSLLTAGALLRPPQALRLRAS